MSARAPDRDRLALEGRTEVTLVVEQLRRRVPGGIGTYVSGLLGALLALSPHEGLEIELYASALGQRGDDPLRHSGLPLRTSRLRAPMATKVWELGFGAIGAPGSVVHAPSFAFPPTKSELVVTVHDLAWRKVPDSFPSRARRWHEHALHRVAKRAAAVVVPSLEVREALLDAAVGLDAGRVAVIEEGADHLPLPDEAATDALLSGLGVTDAFLLSVGTLEPRKNLAALFRAYELARALHLEPWPLVVVGPVGWGRQEHALPSGVLLAGKVDAAVLAGLYRRARLVVYVPLVEGFGLPVVEAMRAEVPVVSSAVPAGANATYLVDPMDVESIADGILAVARETPLRSELIEAGRARSEPLTWERTARAHIALWQALRSGRP